VRGKTEQGLIECAAREVNIAKKKGRSVEDCKKMAVGGGQTGRPTKRGSLEGRGGRKRPGDPGTEERGERLNL